MIKKEFHLELTDYVNKYADDEGIVCLKMGSKTIVVLSNHEVIKEAFWTHDFSARPKGELNLLDGYGKEFKETRLNSLQRLIGSIKETSL